MLKDPQPTGPIDPTAVLKSPVPLPESQVSFEQQRDIVTTAVGIGLTDALARHADYVTSNEAGQHLRLRIPSTERKSFADLTVNTDEAGNRTAVMTFTSNRTWGNTWKYTDGPQQAASFFPCKVDKETGAVTPKEKPADPTRHDPTTAQEIVWWGKPWVGNLQNGVPEKPKKQPSEGSARLLGRLSFSGKRKA